MSGLGGSLIAGTDGMLAQAAALGEISLNIANVNTTGYKAGVEQFQTIVAQQNAPANYQWGSDVPYTKPLISVQGLVEATTQNDNLAIEGRGFFAVASAVNATTQTVASNAETGVTRKGDFSPDLNGFLVNSAGYYLLGQVLPTASAITNASGGTVSTASTSATTIGGLAPVQLSTGDTIGASATTEVDFGVNLPATQTSSDAPLTLDASIDDAAGNSYNVTISLSKVAGETNTWTAQITGASGGTLASGATGSAAIAAAFGTVSYTSTPTTLTFNSSGQIVSPTGGVNLGTVTSSLGSVSPSFNFAGNSSADVGPSTQYDDAFATFDVYQNGTLGGTSTGYNISKDGLVTEQFSDGSSIPKYQIPLVNFINPDGLDAESGNFYQQSATSGAPILYNPASDPIATVQESSLEQSTVDLATELTNMIVTERDYTANVKVVTTSDEMYQTITGLQI
jgi:flagellar hook protein FlgE